MTIYLDAVWLLNFLLDLMLLLLTQSLLRDQTRKIRIIFGAFVASLIVPITIFFPSSFFNHILGKVLYSIIIVLSAFKYKTKYHFIKLLLLFYFISFSIGGGLLSIYFLLNSPISLSVNGLLTLNRGFGDPISWLFIIIGFPIVLLFTRKRMDEQLTDSIRYDQLCPVIIKLNGKSFSTTGFVDSGNHLIDPLTKYPVIICDEKFLKQWFSNSDWQSLLTVKEDLNFEVLPKEWKNKIHLVPYQGVQGISDFLLAIKIDQLIIYTGETKVETNKVLVGIQFANLTKDQLYHCLLHPKIMSLAV